jgi:hypothetical protein
MISWLGAGKSLSIFYSVALLVTHSQPTQAGRSTSLILSYLCVEGRNLLSFAHACVTNEDISGKTTLGRGLLSSYLL